MPTVTPFRFSPAMVTHDGLIGVPPRETRLTAAPEPTDSARLDRRLQEAQTRLRQRVSSASPARFAQFYSNYRTDRRPDGAPASAVPKVSLSPFLERPSPRPATASTQPQQAGSDTTRWCVGRAEPPSLRARAPTGHVGVVKWRPRRAALEGGMDRQDFYRFVVEGLGLIISRQEMDRMFDYCRGPGARQNAECLAHSARRFPLTRPSAPSGKHSVTLGPTAHARAVPIIRFDGLADAACCRRSASEAAASQHKRARTPLREHALATARQRRRVRAVLPGLRRLRELLDHAVRGVLHHQRRAPGADATAAARAGALGRDRAATLRAAVPGHSHALRCGASAPSAASVGNQGPASVCSEPTSVAGRPQSRQQLERPLRHRRCALRRPLTSSLTASQTAYQRRLSTASRAQTGAQQCCARLRMLDAPQLMHVAPQ
jgi:hypothetical protein